MNTNQLDPRQHPLRATAAAIAGISGEQRGPRTSHMMSSNEGPADIIKKVSGCVPGGIREDDAPYFTNNEGIPFPDPWVLAKTQSMRTRLTILQSPQQEHWRHSRGQRCLPLPVCCLTLQRPHLD
jgi:catalase